MNILLHRHLVSTEQTKSRSRSIPPRAFTEPTSAQPPEITRDNTQSGALEMSNNRCPTTSQQVSGAHFPAYKSKHAINQQQRCASTGSGLSVCQKRCSSARLFLKEGDFFSFPQSRSYGCINHTAIATRQHTIRVTKAMNIHHYSTRHSSMRLFTLTHNFPPTQLFRTTRWKMDFGITFRVSMSMSILTHFLSLFSGPGLLIRDS